MHTPDPVSFKDGVGIGGRGCDAVVKPPSEHVGVFAELAGVVDRDASDFTPQICC